MTDFRRHFLNDSIKNLSSLQKRFRANLTEDLRREAFRTIHSVKGGAQTFDFKNAARLASGLEDVLANRDQSADKNLLLEGIALLIDSLRETESDSQTNFTEKLQHAKQTETKSEILLTKISPQIFKSFSPAEQNAVISAIREGKNILCAEIGFQPANFADEYRSLRKSLSERGEIIASLPSEKFKSSGEIGFQIFIATRETAADLQKFLENYPLEISSHTCEDGAAGDLFEILVSVAAHGEKIAEDAGKAIRFNILANETPLSAAQAKTIFDALLHLVRNAVDHAVERSGNIEIRLFDDNENLYLSVADDGKGIDVAKVRARAVAQNLISETEEISHQQTVELIFASEFSTAERLTEISGRGIGLDAVKAAVEALNGKISVKSRKTNGTIFEIYLPKSEL